jgi:hypothetical protein
VRRHWIALVNPVVGFIMGALIPIILAALGQWYFTNVVFIDLQPLAYVFLFGYSVWLLATWVLVFFSWTNYYLDTWIVTNLRIFTIDQKRLFSRELSSFTLDKIHDFTVDIKGVIPTFLKFGDLSIETAAERRIYIFLNARYPQRVKDIINDAQNDYQAQF